MKNMTKKSGSNTSRLLALPTPNYMKSTTSADARREQSKVSTNSPHNSSLHKKGSTNSPNLCLNLSKNVTASLKMMRSTSSRPETTLKKKGTTHGNLQVGRATCSSTLKVSKFPDYLKLNPGSEGTSAVKVCRYSYCSFNGHLHALLPPLKCFASARRRALKPQTQRSIKQRCQSPKATPNGGGPSCVEIICREEQPVSSNGEDDVPGLSNGEMKSQNSHTRLEGDYECTLKMEKETGTCADIITKSDDGIGCFFDEISVDEVSQESIDEESFNSETLIVSNSWGNYLESLCSNKTLAPVLVPGLEAATAVKDDSSFEGNQTPSTGPQSGYTTMCCNAVDGEEHNLRDKSLLNEDATADIGNQASGPVEEMTTLVDGTKCKAIKHDQDHVKNECNQAESFNGVSTKDLTNKFHTGDSRLSSNEGECNVVHELNLRNTAIPETEDRSSTRATAKCKKSNQEYDDPRSFNPRGLQLLPLEPEPETEKVNLRHQELDARKNADEWMVDYALRQAVTKVGTSSQRKVALLVDAFERVVPTSKH